MHRSARLPLVFVLALLAASVVPGTRAQPVPTSGAGIGSFTDYTGFALQDGAGNFQGLPVAAPCQLVGTSIFTTFKVRAGFTLMDGGNMAVGAETFTATETRLVGPHATLNLTLSTVLVPTGIAEGASYRLVAQLYRERSGAPGVWDPLGPARWSLPYRFAFAVAGQEAGTTAWLREITLEREFAIANRPGFEGLRFHVHGVLGRGVGLADPPAVEPVTFQLALVLGGATGGVVPLQQSRVTLTYPLANHSPTGGPVAVTFNETIEVVPAGPLDPSDVYSLVATPVVTEPDGSERATLPAMIAGQKLLFFNGTLRFGAVATELRALDGTNGGNGPAPGGGELATIYLPAGGIVHPTVAGYTAGAPGGLSVALRPDGTADALAAVTWTAAPGAERGVVNGVRFRRGTVTLDDTGFSASPLHVQLPAGLGLTDSPTSRRHKAEHAVPTGRLDETLAPRGLVVMRASDLGVARLYAAHEALPLVFETARITWDVASGDFAVAREDTRHTQAPELDRLDVVRGATGLWLRPSNEQYYRRPLPGPHPEIVFRADAAGRAVVYDALVELQPGDFYAHFPMIARIAWTGAGAVQWRNGIVAPAESSLTAAAAFPYAYTTDCGVACAGGGAGTPAEFALFTPAGNWEFTVDGGLRAAGTIGAAPLRWGGRPGGTYAHETEPFTDARVLLAGHVLHAAFATTEDDQRPGALLEAGHAAPFDESLVERPRTPGYAQGFADYPGLNFRVGADGAKTAQSRLGDRPLGPYALAGTSKYYFRLEGVSGIHEAVTASFTALLGGLEIYGFPMTLDGLRLSYLDNRNRDSRIAGDVAVRGVKGHPGFSQDFTNLALRCGGELGELTLPQPNAAPHTLHYWRAQFLAHRAEFVPTGTTCAPTGAVLVFGADVSLPRIVKEPLPGALGFHSDGHLVTAADAKVLNIVGVDSRLRRPTRISLHGNGSNQDATRPGFVVTPIADLYFNDARPADAPDEGFVSIAGTIDVPFFEDLRVHVLARATGGDTFVRGGWTDAGRTFFTHADFDAANRGFPPTGDLRAYLGDSGFDPVARKDWHGLATFAFPVRWNPLRREFNGTRSPEAEFLVLTSEQLLERLTPSGADLRFGMHFTGLPRVNLAALVIDADEGLGQIVQHLPGGGDLVTAAKTLEQLLAGRSDQLIDQTIDAQVESFLTAEVVPALAALQSAAEAQAYFAGNAVPLGGALRTQLDGLAGTAASTDTILREVDAALGKLDTGLAAADGLLRKGANAPFQLLPDGPRGQFLAASVALAGGQAGGLDLAAEINGPLKGTLDEVHREIVALHDAVGATRGTLDSVRAALQAALAAANGATGLGPQGVEAMRRYFETAALNDAAGRFLVEQAPTAAESRAKVHAELRRLVRDRVHASAFARDLRAALKDLLEPLRDDYRTALDRVNDGLNGLVRDAIASGVGDLANELKGPAADANKAIGAFKDTLELAKLNGTAHIDGDTLTAAHIDAALGLHFPDAVRISGWLDYRHYKSGQPDYDGIPAPAEGRVEVILHAEGKAELADNPPIQATLEGRYAMAPDGSPRAIGGLFDFTSDLQFDNFSLKNLRLEFAFGDRDNYVYGRGQGSVWFIDCDARVFMGRTVKQSVLERVDRDLGPLLGQFGFTQIDYLNPVSGIYCNADGEGSLNEFFGIPDTPLLKIKGRGGEGTFAFLNDRMLTFKPLVDGAKLIVGKRIRRGLDVKLGPVGAGAELIALGALDPLSPLTGAKDPLDVAGSIFQQGGLLKGAITGRFTAEFTVGVWPLEATLEKEFRFTASGAYTPPPLAPPPGFIYVNEIDFD